ncbi:DNA-3-methyladenine glycosylase 2 family protein, partial [Candidatus Woesebacteria bacterium]|nr:DNA-3-methyladenine glycosylase 2 family protein [Candidatus Woesebacteria bacterium]
MWNEAEKYLSKDKRLKILIKKYGPCTIKPLKKSEYFSDLVDAICSQQLSGKAAKTIFGRVSVGVGGKITPEAILKTKDEKLRSFGLSWAKVSYVKDLAKHVLAKELKLNRLSTLSDEEVVAQLIAVKGIGRWTAEMFLMFSLARADIFPIDDLGIKKGSEKLTGKRLTGPALA